MFEGVKEVIKPFEAGVKLLRRGRITYNFPPEMPLTEKARGRHIFNPEKCMGCSPVSYTHLTLPTKA